MLSADASAGGRAAGFWPETWSPDAAPLQRARRSRLSPLTTSWPLP